MSWSFLCINSHGLQIRDIGVELQNHELNEQLMLISQLDEDEKNALVKIINSMLTKKRMKDLLDGKVNF